MATAAPKTLGNEPSRAVSLVSCRPRLEDRLEAFGKADESRLQTDSSRAAGTGFPHSACGTLVTSRRSTGWSCRH